MTQEPQKSSRRNFSKMLDNIIANCKHFEDPVEPNLESSFSKVSVIYKNLNTENFSPGYSDSLFPHNSALLNSYLAGKNSHPTQEDLNKILKSSPTNRLLQNKSSLLTFNSAGEDDMSQLLLNNKRAFGKNWDIKDTESKIKQNRGHFLSADTSPRDAIKSEFLTPVKLRNPKNESKKQIVFGPGTFIKKDIRLTVNKKNFKLPPINSPKADAITPTHRKTSSLPPSDFDLYTKTLESSYKPTPTHFDKEGIQIRSYINHLLEKNLGIRQKKPEDFKRPQKSRKKTPELKDDREFLSSGYNNYNNDLGNKLRVQKIIVAQHRNERRMTLINFPPIKLQKVPS